MPDGRWRGVVNLGWQGGKRRRKYITRGTQAEVVGSTRFKRRSLGVAVRWQLIPWNPVTAVDPPSLTYVEVHLFDAKEAPLVLAAASGDRFQAAQRGFWLRRAGPMIETTTSDVDNQTTCWVSKTPTGRDSVQ